MAWNKSPGKGSGEQKAQEGLGQHLLPSHTSGAFWGKQASKQGMGLGGVGCFPASVPFSGLVFLDAQPCLCIWQWEAALQPLQAFGNGLGWKRGISCSSGYIPTFAWSLGHLGGHRQNPGLWAPDLGMPSFSSRPTPRARSEEERRACQSAHLIKVYFSLG